MTRLAAYAESLASLDTMPIYGRVRDVVGLTIEATGPPMRVGDFCTIRSSSSHLNISVEVVGFRDERILLMPLDDSRGIGPGDVLVPTHAPLHVTGSTELLGRVLNGVGDPMDGGPPLLGGTPLSIVAAPPGAMERTRIVDPITTGVRSIDSFMTCGRGQRMGIMSGSGVGKSKLISMIARNTDADVNVIALIGARGREVLDFIEGDLGEEGLKNSVVIVATSDEPALMRVNGAYLATAVAEYFRDRGAHVMLMMDSVTRFAMAQREIGLAIGEPPTTKGYPPSVFSVLPKLMERPGSTEKGSITGFYAVLVEGDDFNDPIGDSVRSILDGHLVLSRDLATRGHFPAVDVLESISRVMIDVTSDSHRQLANELRLLMATHRDAEDLINIGAYVQGSNPEIDRAIRLVPRINDYLRQGLSDSFSMENIEQRLQQILAG
ncbi:MAG: FliI/YscN family ATPase [Candidatus Hydrogenedentota bacterium]